MGLLVAAHERCRGPEDAGEPALDLARFKELVRGLDLWCSSCMVAIEGGEPVGVVLGAKRPAATLVYSVRVHPEFRRRGHGRHLLTSLGQKLAILGPPRLVAEVPAEREAARALLHACRWQSEATLVDWRRAALSADATGGLDRRAAEAVAPIALDEAAESGLLGGALAWHRDLAAVSRRPDGVLALGFHSPERLEACLVARSGASGCEILALGSSGGELGRLGARLLVAELERRMAGTPLSLERVAPGEIDGELLRELGFAPGRALELFATEAKAA